jgi:hypothetical protein
MSNIEPTYVHMLVDLNRHGCDTGQPWITCFADRRDAIEALNAAKDVAIATEQNADRIYIETQHLLTERL